MFTTRSFVKFAAALAVSFSVLAADRASAAVVLLDTVSSADAFNVTSSTPHNYMGDGFTNSALPAGTTSFQITGFDLYFASIAATNYTDIVGRIQFWNKANGGTTSTTNPAFSNAAGSLVSVDFGALTTAASTIYSFTVTLNTPITLTGGSGTNWGFAQNFQGSTTGGAVADDANLESLISSNTAGTFATGAVTTGVSPTFGYYRNANSETNFNFTSTARSLTGLNAQGIAIVIRGNAIIAPVPEPSSVVMAALGGLGLIGGAYRARRRQA